MNLKNANPPSIYLACVLLTAAIFIIDFYVQLGVASGVAYIAVIWIMALTGNVKTLWVTAIVCSGLNVLGYFVSPEGSEVWKVVVNRSLAIFVICLTAFYVAKLKSSEKAQHRLESHFRTVIESAPTAMVMIGQDGQITLANTEAERLFGYSREELIGHSIEVLLPERFRGVHSGHRHLFFGSPESRKMGAGRELFASHKSGREFQVEIGLNPVETENGLFVISAITDVTERKRIEQLQQEINAELATFNTVLGEKTRLLESVVNGVAEGFVAVDCEGNFLLFNENARKILGIGAADVGGSKWSEHYGLFYEDKETIFPQDELPLMRALQGERVDNVIMYLRNEYLPEGTYLQVSACPRLDEAGNIEGAVAAFHDITMIKRTEEELKVQNEEMEQFVYTVSHDLKSPLVTSKGFLGFLREDLADENMEDVLDSVGRIEKAADKMSNLIDDLLNLSRIGRVGNDPAPIDMDNLMGRLSNQFSPLLEEKETVLEIHSDLPEILGDDSAIERVFENLISNALKYGASDEGSRIEIGAQHSGKELLFYVRDNGQGIDPEYHDKIFGLFQRVDVREEGTGIGLSITAKIVRVHGGRIWVASEPRHGATFWIAFPVTITSSEIASY